MQFSVFALTESFTEQSNQRVTDNWTVMDDAMAACLQLKNNSSSSSGGSSRNSQQQQVKRQFETMTSVHAPRGTKYSTQKARQR